MTPKVTPLPIPEEVKEQFYNIKTAAHRESLALVSARTKSGEQHYVLCIVHLVPGSEDLHMHPVARMMADSEFDNYEDPTI